MRDAAVDHGHEHVLQKVRAWRRGALFRDAGVAFLHVPKAAGTSVCDALYGRFIGHFGVRDLLAVAPAGVRSLPRFSVVRNPWDRVVSAWSFARAGSGQGGKIDVAMHRPEQYRVPEFQDFRRFVLEWLPAQRADRLDGIFRPQADYITDRTGRLALDHVGRVEAMDETEAWLSGVLGREIRFGKGNASRHAGYRSYYDDETAAAVARHYARDIELLDYRYE